MELSHVAFLGALVSATAVAFRFGGKPEAEVAVAVIVAAMATPFAEISTFSHPEWGILLVDLALLAVLLRVVFTSDRRWVLFAAGFHLATILTHTAPLTGPTLLPEAYAAASVFWAYLVLLSLAVGSYSISRRLD